MHAPLRAAASLALVALAACGGSASTSSTPTPSTATYQLHMDFFSHETGLHTVIDPQVFVQTPGAPAGTGPQQITHVAGLAPAPKSGPSSTPLFSADGTGLGITRGQWLAAAGTVSFSCTNGREEAASHLTGLIPGGTYSTFVVHLDVSGAGRFTPWGDAAGATNNFTADTTGAATPTNSLAGCLGKKTAALIVWHSDGHTHGASPGRLGVTWHNSLITPLP